MIQLPLYMISSRPNCCGCCKRRSSKYLLKQSDVSNQWVRFFIETFLEFVISCLVGIKLLFLINGEANEQDHVSHKLSFMFLAIICLFSVLIVYLSLFKGKELKVIKKEIVKRKV